jgi:protein involved in polysaccharide export with SLBB domain
MPPSGCCRKIAVSGTAWALLGLASLATAQSPDPGLTFAAELPAVSLSRPYRIQVNDVLDFLFFKAEELNQSRTVGPDGRVSLQLVGSVRVAGRTLDDITSELDQRYAAELVDPQVTVAVKDFSGLKVYVGGEVNQPGLQEYRGGLTTLQAVLAAGGFKDSASLKSVALIRQADDGTPIGTVVDLSRVLKKAEFDRDIALAPADIIFVPRSGIAKVNLWVDQWIRQNIPIPITLGYNIYTPR